MVFINQYDRVPEIKSQLRFWFVLGGILILTISGFLIWKFFKPTVPFCGNGICENTENCYSCSSDCKCSAEEYCSLESKSCTKPVCGNKECEPFERPDECCIDCGCWGVNICDITENKCKEKVFNISDERVIELVTDYFNTKGYQVSSMEIGDIIVWDNKLSKNIAVNLTDREWFTVVLVTENEEVFEVPV